MWEPLHRSRPSHRWTNGDLAAKVGADLGLPPDDEQRWLLDAIYAEREPEVPASFEVATIAPRQNIKTSTYGIAALADLFVFGVERHLWTAHHGDTLKGTFQDFRSWIKSNRDYEDQVTFYEGHQDMAIVHTETGNMIDFQSRTGKAGRGLTGVKRITVDEGLYLEPKHVGAIFPTMLTRRGAQVRTASSAGLLASEELRRIRNRGRTGKEPRFTYVEYGAPLRKCQEPDCSHVYGLAEGCALDDRELWWHSNCALWAGRITEEAIENQRRSLPPAEFMREFFSWWEDPISEGGALPLLEWLRLADPSAELGTVESFGVHVQEDRSAWITASWKRPDGNTHVILANNGKPVRAHKVVEKCKELTGTYGGQIVPPDGFADELRDKDVPVVEMPGGDWHTACVAVADAIDEESVRHGNQPALNEAVRAAEWRSAGAKGERAFKDTPEGGPLMALVRGLWGCQSKSIEPFAMWG